MTMLTLDGWPAAPTFVSRSRSHHHRAICLTGRASHLAIFSPGRRHPSQSLRRRCPGTRSDSPRSAYVEGTLVAENSSSLAHEHRKEREARIRKQFQQVTVSPSAYDTAWVSMVPLPGSPHTPCFPQCIEWVLQNQKDNGSWGINEIGKSANKDILLSTLACVVALKKWNLGEEHVRRGLQFIGMNSSIVMDKQTAAPIGFTLIFPGMLSLAIEMGLQLSAFRETDIDEILRLREEEFDRLSREKSPGTKEYIAYVSEGLGNLVNWSEVMNFQRKNGSLFNSPSTTAALLIHCYDDQALKFLTSVVSKCGSAVPTVYPQNIHGQLSLVDSLEKIGMSQHFSSEIKDILEKTYSLWLQRDEEIMLDFATTSIAFRLLRMNGYGVSHDELSHVADVSSFHNSLQGYLNDTKSLLELYKASKVSIYEDELTLDNIGIWSSILLTELPLDRVPRLPILREVEYALKFPFYTTLELLDHRRNIENFDVRDSQMLKTEYMPCGVNEDIISLAVEDFTLSQCIYQAELAHLDSWMKEHKLDQLQFARQKATYCYLLAAGSITHNELVDARISFAKNAVLVTVIDDFFDVEGSKEQMEDLIGLVEKWDEHYNDKLCSPNVIILFSALYTTVKELGSMVSAVQNFDITEHLIEEWLHVLRSMMTEAEWQMNQYVPTFEEYMENAVVSISYGPVVLPTLCFLGQTLSKSIVKDQEYNELLRLTSTCTRFLNDIQGLEREVRAGKLNSVTLLVHHSNGSTSIEMAKDAISKSIITTTKDMLRLVLKGKNDIPLPCKEVFWKMCKMSHYIFFEADAYTSPTTINALFYQPIKLPD